jgi:2-desacetyl-2-hydroxyethyl bacteriochlorophyllide A dehydrogenase
MQAVLVDRPGSFTVSTVDDPTPNAREVVLQIDGCGICGTDIHLIDGELTFSSYPVVPGHEFAGTIVAVGTGVTEFTTGDRVAADPNMYCGECHYCSIGRGNLCANFAALGLTHNGACAQFTVVPVANCFLLPDDMPLEIAPLIEPLSCVVHAFDRLPGRVGEHYLIYGAGTMGLMNAQMAARAGAASVSVIDINESRLAVAKQLGADAVGTNAEALDRPEGWEVVIDATGVVPAIEDGIRRVRPGGTFLMFGVASADAVAKISPFEIYNNEITIMGSMAVLHSFGRAVDLMAKGVIDAATLISHRYSLDDYATAVGDFRAGVGRKLQIRPGGV